MLKSLGGFLLSIVAASAVALFKFYCIDKKHFVSKKEEQYVVDTYRVSNKIVSRIIKNSEGIDEYAKSTYYVNPIELSSKLNSLNSDIEKYYDIYSEIESFVTDSLIRVDSEELKNYLSKVQNSNRDYLYCKKILEENSKALCFYKDNRENIKRRKLILKALIEEENKIRNIYPKIIKNLKIIKTNLVLSNSKFLGIHRGKIKRDKVEDFFYYGAEDETPFLTAKNQTGHSLPNLFIADSISKRENNLIKNRILIKSLPKCFEY